MNRDQRPIAAANGGRFMRRILILMVVASITATAFTISFTSASTLPTPSNAPGLNERTLTANIKAIVQDDFTGSSGNIVGTTPEMQNRSNVTTAYSGFAPPWVGTLNGSTTTGQWTFTSDRAVRNTGNNDYSMLLLPYMKRKTVATAQIRNLTTAGTDTEVGVVIGANYAGSGTNNGTEGLAASLWHNGSWEFSLWLQTGGSASTICSTPVTVTGPSNNNTIYTIALTYDPSNPAGGATASLTRSAGGSWNLTSNCSLATADNNYAGLISYESSAAHYDTFSVDFS